MRRESNHTLPAAEVDRLFMAAVDGELVEADAVRWQAAVDADPELKGRYERVAKTVSLLARAPKEKAPEALASLILRRTRRRRFHGRSREVLYARFPAEVVIPMVIAALVAMFMLLASP